MNFFGIGYGEILIIVVAALIIFGPQRLPEVAGQAARWLRDARKMMTDMSSEFERNAGVREFKSAIEGEIAGVRKELEGAGASVRSDLQAAAGTANAAVKSASNAAKGTSAAKPKATATSAGTAKTTSTTASKAKPKASKDDPFAGLVSLAEAKPKTIRSTAIATNGHKDEPSESPPPIRETSEAVMRARERRLTAGYNRHISAP